MKRFLAVLVVLGSVAVCGYAQVVIGDQGIMKLLICPSETPDKPYFMIQREFIPGQEVKHFFIIRFTIEDKPDIRIPVSETREFPDKPFVGLTTYRNISRDGRVVEMQVRRIENPPPKYLPEVTLELSLADGQASHSGKIVCGTAKELVESGVMPGYPPSK